MKASGFSKSPVMASSASRPAWISPSCPRIWKRGGFSSGRPRPIEYLERLLLQNELVLGLNRLEGVIDQDEADLALWNVMQRFLLLTQFLLNLYLCSLAFKGFGVVDA
jgi:hypothetical protein